MVNQSALQNTFNVIKDRLAFADVVLRECYPYPDQEQPFALKIIRLWDLDFTLSDRLHILQKLESLGVRGEFVQDGRRRCHTLHVLNTRGISQGDLSSLRIPSLQGDVWDGRLNRIFSMFPNSNILRSCVQNKPITLATLPPNILLKELELIEEWAGRRGLNLDVDYLPEHTVFYISDLSAPRHSEPLDAESAHSYLFWLRS